MAMDGLQASTGTIHTEVLAICSDVKEELSGFHDNLSGDMKRDLTSFSDDVDEKLKLWST